MAINIKCPSCGNSFPMEQSIRDEIQGEFRQKLIEEQKKRDEQTKQKEQILKTQIEELQKTLQQQDIIVKEKILKATNEKEAEIRKQIISETETKLKFLEEKSSNDEQKINKLQQIELEGLRLQNELEELKRTSQNEKEKYLLENSRRMIEEALKGEKETFDLERKEFQIKLEQQRKQVDDMKKKLEQGSMQLQGEAQELLIEEILANAFPFDLVTEVSKGKKGADCLLVIHDKFGNECGKILFESKRTSTWGKDWVDKLKQDLFTSGADVGVLVSQTLPDRICDKFDYEDGIWICGFSEIKILATAIREGLIRIKTMIKTNEGKGDKVQLLYEYMTSSEFAAQWKNIREVFRNMHSSISQERAMMEKIWKNRERQLDSALLYSSHIMGSIEGIAGKNSIDMNLIEEGNEQEIPFPS